VAELADANAVVKCPYCRATSSSDDMLSVPFPEVSDVIPEVSPQRTIDEVIACSKEAHEDWQLMLLENAYCVNHWNSDLRPTMDVVLQGCFRYHGFINEYKQIPHQICDVLGIGELNMLLDINQDFFDGLELANPCGKNPTDWKTRFLTMLDMATFVRKRSESEWL